MSGPRIGSLCSGYGGLDQGVQAVYGGRTVWVSDIDKGANKILAHRYGDVPNLGDFTKLDWSTVEPIDILTAGFPCQPVSHAGKRLGDDDERWLWDDVARAVRSLRPGLVVLENVRGLLTARSGRLFGRVLGSLADLGYDARWHGLRAADVGAPHGRWRVFIAATDTRGQVGLERPGLRADEPTRDGRRLSARMGGPTLLPTPRATDGTKGGPNQRGSSGDLMLPSAVALLPTPTASEPGGTAEQYRARWAKSDGRVSTFVPLSMTSNWGDYAAAIARWEHTLGRPAPAPTMTSTKGNPQLSPAFVEWLMGLPAGWVTDIPGITRNEALKALGNGVVPQQATAALRTMLAWEVAA